MGAELELKESKHGELGLGLQNGNVVASKLPPSYELKKAPREPISAFVVAFNEEAHIRRCLKSLSFCDEIVVIDSLSTDRTVEIAKECGAKVIKQEWLGYKEQKAFGLSSTSNDWAINLDADEEVSQLLKESIIKALEKAWEQNQSQEQDSEETVNGYSMTRVVYYLGRWWVKGGWYPEHRLRFFRKSKVTWGGLNPHERVYVKGKTERLEGELFHFTYENLEDQFSKLHSHSSVAALEEFKRGTKPSLTLLLFNPIVRMLLFFVFKKGYREGVAGLIVSIAEGYYTFMKYAKLWGLYLERDTKESSVFNEK